MPHSRIVTAALDAAGDPAVRKAVTDVSASAGVVTMPWWIDLVSYGYHGLMGAGAVILLGGRLVLMWREIQGKRKAKVEG